MNKGLRHSWLVVLDLQSEDANAKPWFSQPQLPDLQNVAKIVYPAQVQGSHETSVLHSFTINK